MTELIIATGNAGKLREIRAILPEYKVLSQKEAGVNIEVEETGTTFAENALLKARAIFEATGKPTVADDSGLVVDALDGAPGIYSARYAGEDATDEERNQKLLEELSDVPDEQRTARFVCVIAYVDEQGREYTFEGKCEGIIAHAPEGPNGFGYDPLFFSPDHGVTFGVFAPEIKNQVSHRSAALKLFRKFLDK